MKSNNKQILYGAIISYISVILGIITGIIFNPWMIKNVGDSDYALYTLAMSLVNTLLIDFGLSMATQKYISKFIAEKNEESINNILGLIYKMYIIITILLSLIFFILFFFLDNIYVKLTDFELSKFKIIYIMISIYSVITFPFVTLNGILSAYEKFIPLKTCDLIYKILYVVLTSIGLFIGWGIYFLVFVSLFSSIIVIVIRLIYIYKFIKPHINFKYKNIKESKEIINFSLWISLSTIILRLFISLGPSILGMVANSFEIAVFGYAVSIEGFFYMFVNAINGFFMPKLSIIVAQNTKQNCEQKVLNLMIEVGKIILILFSLIFFGFLIMGNDFINLLVGKEYSSAYYCVLLICGYGFIAYPQQIANTYLIIKDEVKKKGIISLISFVIYIFLVFILGKKFGAIGVSIGIFVSLMLQTIMINYVYYKKLNINIFLFFKNCHLRLIPGIIIFICYSLLIKTISLVGWLGFFVKVALIFMGYLIICYILFLSKSQRKLILKKLKIIK